MTPEEQELNRQVAEGMGATLQAFSVDRGGDVWAMRDGHPDAWFLPDGKFLAYRNRWNPCNRPDHWWRVVEWVREQPEVLQADFGDALAEITKRFQETGWMDSFYGFFLWSNPGEAICKAFLAVKADG